LEENREIIMLWKGNIRPIEEIERMKKARKTFVSFHKTCENTNQNNNMKNSIA
jgi:hypothetical protein